MSDVAMDRELELLIADLGGSVPADVIREVVCGAGHDLDGQIPMDALPELLHRSAVQRLISCRGGDR